MYKSLPLKDNKLFRQQCYINGIWCHSANRKVIEVQNPATNAIIGTVPEMGKEETRAAILSAEAALPLWRSKTAKERASILKKWYELIINNIEDLAMILCAEQGKPFSEAQGEIRYGASFIEWFAEEAKRIYGDIIASAIPHQRSLVIKQAIGVVGAITPWNFPNAMITRKCAPALAAGCTVIIKPSELTPLSALALAELAERAGIPKGVINIVTGLADEIGKELSENPKVRKISFTGSTRVGKLLLSQTANTVKKVSLELGGNAPFIIFDDADLDAAVSGLIASKFRNTGQTCVCANRILVQENIYDAFIDKLTRAVKSLRVGGGMENGVQLGPLINTAAIAKIETLIKDALTLGAKIVCGGRRHPLGGLFFEPTILSHVNTDMRIANEEVFGPVAPLFKFRDESEAIKIANDTEYGLASYFYSKDLSRIWRLSEALEYGIVCVNSGVFSNEMAPFGGVKESGIGREGSKYGIDEYIEIKYIALSI